MSVSSVAVTTSELTPQEAWDLFDARSRSELGVTGDEFVKHIDAGEVLDEWAPDAVSRLEMLLPFVR